MSFLSYSFAGFVVLSLFFYEILPRKYKPPFLLLASGFFYCLSGVKAFLLLSLSAAAFFGLALRMERADDAGKRTCLFSGIFLQLSILIFLKHQSSFSSEGLGALLPLGISYYTFKLIGYLVDVYLGKEKAERNFISFANYTAFFPQIPCGPIQRSRDFLPQMNGILGMSPELAAGGLRLILCGLFKKLVVSGLLIDYLELFLSRSPGHAGLLSIYLVPVEIYADFSGITDIAVGLGRLFGFQSPGNFAQPFYAPSIQEFWRRWHITLTDWILEYVFTPLQIAARDLGRFGLVISISATMIGIGLWHGFAWNWLAFGCLHAFYLSLSVMTSSFRNAFFQQRPALNRIRPLLGAVVTFHMVAASFIFFKASTWADAAYFWKIVRSAAFLHRPGFNPGFGELLLIAGAVGVMEMIHFIQNDPRRISRFLALPAAFRWLVYTGMIGAIAWMGNGDNRTFTYTLF